RGGDAVTMSAAMPVLLLHGSPFERGRQHGRHFATAIRDALAQLRARLGRQAWGEARRRAAQAPPPLERLAPHLEAELAGLAEGAGCDPLDIHLRVGFEFLPEEPAIGCSAIAVHARGTAIIGQNWDAPPGTSSELGLFIHSGARGFEQALIASI